MSTCKPSLEPDFLFVQKKKTFWNTAFEFIISNQSHDKFGYQGSRHHDEEWKKLAYLTFLVPGFFFFFLVPGIWALSLWGKKHTIASVYTKLF